MRTRAILAFNALLRRFLCLLMFPILCLCNTPAAAAITWEAAEPVDQPVTEVSSTSGASAVWINDSWHVVYCRGGQVFRRVRAPGGWQAIETVSTAPGAASNPHLAWTGTILYVVWEDNRTGGGWVVHRHRLGSRSRVTAGVPRLAVG